jgi:hypothetical protein
MSAMSSPALAPLTARLAPYARASFERAAELAARLHADEISPEHWLAALLADESCAATRAVLHAFADPETIGVEVLALCAGIMVVGSERTLAFSVRGVEALRAARARAARRAGTQVEPADVFHAALGCLTPELGSRLAQLGGATLDPGPGDPPPSREAGTPVRDTGPLFRHFSQDALRALGASGKFAATLGRSSIGPAHLVLGTLEADAALRERTRLTPGRVRLACAGLDEDETPLPPRALDGDERVHELLAALPEGGGTLDVLGWILARGSAELVALLRRQKVTYALFERCRGAYQDPPRPEREEPGR